MPQLAVTPNRLKPYLVREKQLVSRVCHLRLLEHLQGGRSLRFGHARLLEHLDRCLENLLVRDVVLQLLELDVQTNDRTLTRLRCLTGVVEDP